MKLTHIQVFFLSFLLTYCIHTKYSGGYENFVKMIENAGGGWPKKNGRERVKEISYVSSVSYKEVSQLFDKKYSKTIILHNITMI